MDRRDAVRSIGLTVAGLLVSPMVRLKASPSTRRGARSISTARLRTRPHAPSKSIAGGLSKLRLGNGDRDGLLQVPTSHTEKMTAPLVVLLHGAGESADQIVARNEIGSIANDLGIVLLVPDSRGVTWDMMRSDFGPDIEFIDRALAYTFDRCSIDASRVALAGFSDGASYALSVGLANGDLFSRLMAFSPGFVETPERNGKPSIFISHGTRDRILNIDNASRRIVPRLKSLGYDVEYNEFDGPHTPPSDMVRKAFSELVGRPN